MVGKINSATGGGGGWGHGNSAYRTRDVDMMDPDIDVDHTNQEAELARLQRQYRIMEQDRKTYIEDTQNMIRKQKQEIERLEKEKECYEMDLKIVNNEQNQRRDQQNAEFLKLLLENQDRYLQLIKEETEKHSELDEQIRIWEKRLLEQQSKIGNVNVGTQKAMSAKKIKVLENRLNNATINFNTILSENAKIRGEIDNLLYERQAFETHYQKLVRELEEGKKEMQRIVEEATEAYDQRDDALNKMAQLKERNDKEQAQYNQEMKELIRTLNHDQRMKDFMQKKAQEREYQEDTSAKTKKRAKESKATKEKGQEETVESYEQAFAKICDALGEDDIDKLVEKFCAIEDKNFALFNYVNELNNEVETLQEQIINLNNQIEEFKKKQERQEQERANTMQELESRLTQVGDECKESEEKLSAVRNTLDALKEGVERLFKRIRCDDTILTEQLAGTTEVTDTNIMQFLSIIEHRANDLLRLHKYVQYKRKMTSEMETAEEAVPGIRTISPMEKHMAAHIKPMGKETFLGMPPPTGEEDEYESDEEISDLSTPLNYNDLKNKVTREVIKKELNYRAYAARADAKRGKDKNKKGKKKQKHDKNIALPVKAKLEQDSSTELVG